MAGAEGQWQPRQEYAQQTRALVDRHSNYYQQEPGRPEYQQQMCQSWERYSQPQGVYSSQQEAYQ